MKVVSDKKFGKYPAGEAFELPDKMAKVFIKVGKLTAVNGSPVLSEPTYQTRMMQMNPVTGLVSPEVVHADSVETSLTAAPWGLKADGTPRKRPGRPASVTE